MDVYKLAILGFFGSCYCRAACLFSFVFEGFSTEFGKQRTGSDHNVMVDIWELGADLVRE